MPPLRRDPRLALIPVALGLCACPATEEEPARFLHLTQMDPAPEKRVGVFLNERFSFHFSADVDPASVTKESVQIRAAVGGARAKGHFEVQGSQVLFKPELGEARDLSDGGLKPGTRYEVLVRGFPALDGLRSTEGWPLAASGAFQFETARFTEPKEQLFGDDSPERGDPLHLQRQEYLGEESLLLRCTEPLDPSTLVDGEFVLRPQEAPTESIPLDPLLDSNTREDGALLMLRPRRLLGPGVYRLQAPAGASIRDFAGNPVWYPARPGLEPRVLVREPGQENQKQPEVALTFLDNSMSSRLVVEEVDGTAYWQDSGVITVRFPRSAGDGGDGELRLAGAESRSELNATGLEVREGEQVQLLSVPGLVILRAQGKLRIDGSLRRAAGASAETIDGSFTDGEALSAWLERAQVAQRNWTVLVAGGDLVIDGEVDVDGPLLLAAGGRIRVTGRVSAQDDELWLVGGGGGGRLDPTASHAELVLDPPFENPLVRPLRFGVLSSYLPSSGGVQRWLEPEVHAEARNGAYEIRYLPADIPIGKPLEDWGAVESPRDLLEADRLRVLVILTAEPDGPESAKRGRWYPPLVDDVHLVWERPRR